METANNPSDSNEGPKNMVEQVAAYQKIWADTIGKLMQSAITLPPNSAPPDVLREMRGGIFQGLAKSWDEFFRSPQFLQGMRQSMEGSVMLRSMANDFLTRMHHEMQGTAKSDIDNVMLTVRHMEQRILDRLEKVEEQIGARSGPRSNGGAAKARRRPAARTGRKQPRSKTKTST